MLSHNCVFEWEHRTCEAFGFGQMGERVMHKQTSSSDSFKHNWVIHKHGVMELQSGLKCLFNTFLSSVAAGAQGQCGDWDSYV